MTRVLVEILFGCFSLFFCQGWCSTIQPLLNGSLDYEVNISCFFINLQYIDCKWPKTQMQEINFTTNLDKGSFVECPEYLQEDGQRIGCRIPAEPEMKFKPLSTMLFVKNYSAISKYYQNLIKRVILNPPSNLTVNMTQEDEICLSWKHGIRLQCVVSMIRYQKDSGKWTEIEKDGTTSYCISPVSKGVSYTLQVRIKMGNMCGESNYWSNWSLVWWSNNKDFDPLAQEWTHILFGVLALLILIILCALLCYYERKKLALFLLVPAPGKSLQELFHKYNGNVETWVYISKELKEAFEPNFTESPCVVTEQSPSQN